MKLTWFGGSTIRIHIGGAILVLDPEGAPAGIDRTELVSGADRVIGGFGVGLPEADPASWKPRRAQRLIDAEGASSAVVAWSVGPGAVLVEAEGEAPLLLLAGEVPGLGRWAESAVICLFGEGLAALGQAVLAERAPRLLALAASEVAVDAAVPALRERLDGTGLVALEPGLAVEV